MIRYSQNPNYIICIEGTVQGAVDQSDVTGALFSWTNEVYPKCSIPKLQNKGQVSKVQIDTKFQKSQGITQVVIQVPHNGAKVDCSVLAALIETMTKVSLYSASFKLRNITEYRKDYSTLLLKRAKQIYTHSFQSKDSVDPLEALTELISEKPLVSAGSFTLGSQCTNPSVKELILVEGRRDVAKLASMTINNTLAIGGVTFDRQKLLEFVANKELILMFDGDKGGRVICEKVCELMEEHPEVAVIKYIAEVPENGSVEDLPTSQISKILSKKVSYERYREKGRGTGDQK